MHAWHPAHLLTHPPICPPTYQSTHPTSMSSISFPHLYTHPLVITNLYKGSLKFFFCLFFFFSTYTMGFYIFLVFFFSFSQRFHLCLFFVSSILDLKFFFGWFVFFFELLFLLVMKPFIMNYVSCVIFVKFNFNTNFGFCYFNHNPFLLHFFSYKL
jgi:hypothetical protein